MLNYEVERSLLAPHVPAGTELDTCGGKVYASLVGFEFRRTRMRGVPIPFHQCFEEVNLRFYVRRGGRRGVVFIRELVPKRAVAWIARWIYNENYARVPMSHEVVTAPGRPDALRAQYAWRSASNWCAMWVATGGPAYLPELGSGAEFITEHYWGYAAQRNGGTLEYEVRHPPWEVWNAIDAGFEGDTGGLYGASFAEILARPPDSAFLAKGSDVKVFEGVRLPD